MRIDVEAKGVSELSFLDCSRDDDLRDQVQACAPYFLQGGSLPWTETEEHATRSFNAEHPTGASFGQALTPTGKAASSGRRSRIFARRASQPPMSSCVSGIERDANFTGEVTECRWLLKEYNVGIQDPIVDDRVATIPRRKHNW